MLKSKIIRWSHKDTLLSCISVRESHMMCHVARVDSCQDTYIKLCIFVSRIDVSWIGKGKLKSSVV